MSKHCPKHSKDSFEHLQFNEKWAIHTSFVQGSQPDGERFGQQSGLLNEVLFHLAPKHM